MRVLLVNWIALGLMELAFNLTFLKLCTILDPISLQLKHLDRKHVHVIIGWLVATKTLGQIVLGSLLGDSNFFVCVLWRGCSWNWHGHYFLCNRSSSWLSHRWLTYYCLINLYGRSRRTTLLYIILNGKWLPCLMCWYNYVFSLISNLEQVSFNLSLERFPRRT